MWKLFKRSPINYKFELGDTVQLKPYLNLVVIINRWESGTHKGTPMYEVRNPYYTKNKKQDEFLYYYEFELIK